MKKQILFILTGLMLAMGAGAVIYETTGTDLQVWIQNTIVYSAKVSDIDSISTQETANAKKIRMWVNQAMAYEADVRGIDSITFAESVEPIEPDTIPADTIPAAELSMQVWINNAIVYTARVSDIDSISAQQTANAKNIRVWVNQAVAYEADVRGIDSITFAQYIEHVIPPDTIPTDTIPVIPPDTIPTDTIPVIPPDTIPTDTIPTDTIPVIPPDTIPTDTIPTDTIPVVTPDTIPVDTIPVVEPEVVKGFTCSSDGRQLVFAKGNLQYQGNSNTWRFAEHPWDTCGHDNAYMSPVTRKWVDLFGFMRADLPALTRSESSFYTDAAYYSFVKVPISNGGGYKWWVPGASEYEYIIDKRTNHAKLFSGATVNGIAGLVLLPDEWVLPEGLSFVSAEAAGLKDKGSTYSGVSNIFALNTYTAEEWMRMDSAGAVFLPAAGYRNEYTVSYMQQWGEYWTSAVDGTNDAYAYCIEFTKSKVTLNYKVPKPGGRAVRMIRYLNDTIRHNPTAPEPKPASVTFTANEDSTQLLFAPGNLQYIDGKYYFAQHQYDTLGTTNRTAGLVTTDGYVGSYAMDLFGWGTATNPLLMSSESSDYQTFTNWGTMPIMNTTETWSTPGMSELRYILRHRNYADKLFGGATINGIAGLIILPDHFVVPEGIEFHSSTDPDMGYVKYDDHYKSTDKSLYTHNTYTLAEWAQMEAAGAVFLPAAGFRGGSGENTHVSYSNEEGYYWTSSIRVNTSGAAINPAVAYGLIFSPSIVGPEEEHFRHYGRSVRLVRTVK